MCDNLAESSPSADSLQTLELLHEQGDAMGACCNAYVEITVQARKFPLILGTAAGTAHLHFGPTTGKGMGGKFEQSHRYRVSVRYPPNLPFGGRV